MAVLFTMHCSFQKSESFNIYGYQNFHEGSIDEGRKDTLLTFELWSQKSVYQGQAKESMAYIQCRN